MKLIIAGSRTLKPSTQAISFLINDFGLKPKEIVSGTAKGVDAKGEVFAKVNNIPIKRFPANWNKYGRSAGVIRNKEMAHYADALLLIWNGHSNGSKNMMKMAKEFKIQVFEVILRQDQLDKIS